MEDIQHGGPVDQRAAVLEREREPEPVSVRGLHPASGTGMGWRTDRYRSKVERTSLPRLRADASYIYCRSPVRDLSMASEPP